MNGRPFFPPPGQAPYPMPPGGMPGRPPMGMPGMPMAGVPGYPPMGMPYMAPPGTQVPPGPPPGRPPYMMPPGAPPGAVRPMLGLPPVGPPSTLPLPIPSAPSANPAEDAANWTEHTTNDGRKYWHNKVTKVSTYDKPACLSAPPKPVVPTPPEEPKWKEYKTPEGKVYYSDGKTSLWEEPEDIKTYKTKLAEYEAKKKAFEAAASSESGGSPSIEVVERAEKPKPKAIEVNDDSDSDDVKAKKEDGSKAVKPVAMPIVKQELDDGKPLVFDTPEDAMLAFKAMLSAYNVSSSVKWADAQRSCSKDRRWNILKTTGEKKQAFAEYQTKRLKEEREEKRAKARKARDNFLKMLAECAEIDAKTRWHKAEELLKDDPRFNNPELDVRDKEDIFNDFVTELAKKEKEERKANMKMFGELLRKFPDAITHKTSWKECDALLNSDKLDLDHDDKHVRDIVDEVDKRHAFEDYVLELERAYLERKRQEKEERRRQERANEDAFRNMLKEKAKTGEISMDSRWREYKPTIESHELFMALAGQGGKTAAELFEGVVDELRETFRNDKMMLRAIMPKGPDIKHDSVYEEWEAGMLTGLDEGEESENRRLKEFKELLEVRPGNVKVMFTEIRDKALAHHREEMRIREKRIERFKDLLIEYYYRSDHVGIPWKEAQDELKKHSAYSNLDPEDRQKLFEEHMAFLQAKKEKKTKAQAELLAKSAAAAAAGGGGPEGGEDGGAEGKENVAGGQKQQAEGGEVNEHEEDDDDESDSDDEERSSRKKKKASKKHKDKKHKDKKHKKRKRRDRSRSRSGERRHHNGKKRSRSRSASSSDGSDRSRSRDKGSKKRRGRSAGRSTSMSD